MIHRLKNLIIVLAVFCLLAGQSVFAMDSADVDSAEEDAALMEEIQRATNDGVEPTDSPSISPAPSRSASPAPEEPILNNSAFASTLPNKSLMRRSDSFTSSNAASSEESDLYAKVAVAKKAATSKND
jgi:hypothetical protein